MATVHVAKRLKRFEIPYYTREYLEKNNPSTADGVSLELQARTMQAGLNLLINACVKLKIDHTALAYAAELLHRFYARWSMRQTDIYLMVHACIYVAGKALDCPKSVKDVLFACLERATGGDSNTAARQTHTKNFMEPAKDKIFCAERALLYTLGYRFPAKPYETAQSQLIHMLRLPMFTKFLNRLEAKQKGVRSRVAQFSIFYCDQSIRTTLVLQFPPAARAAACIWIALKMLKVDTTELNREHEGYPWYYAYNLGPKDLESFSDQLMELLFEEMWEPAREAEGKAISAKQYLVRAKTPTTGGQVAHTGNPPLPMDPPPPPKQ